MSDNGDSKSMDDVLASIRRIVHGDRNAPASAASGTTADGGESAPEPPDAGQAAVSDDVPLELTPDMRTDGADPDQQAADPAPEAPVETPVEEPAPPEEMAGPDPQPAPAEAAPPADEGMAIDPDQLRDMVRGAVMEALNGDQGDALIRGVIRDELVNGEIGGNISQNVMRLIQSEVSKALKG
ncbi:MAG: hypothetical protein AAF674_17475 [Pseudomonadota bacterium]